MGPFREIPRTELEVSSDVCLRQAMGLWLCVSSQCLEILRNCISSQCLENLVQLIRDQALMKAVRRCLRERRVCLVVQFFNLPETAHIRHRHRHCYRYCPPPPLLPRSTSQKDSETFVSYNYLHRLGRTIRPSHSHPLNCFTCSLWNGFHD